MYWLKMLVAVFLSACASAVSPSASDVDRSTKQSGCIHECETAYSACTQNAFHLDMRLAANEYLRVCDGGFKSCTQDCPAAR